MPRTAPPPRQVRQWIPGKVELLKRDPGIWRRVRLVDSHSQASPVVARFKALGCQAVARKTRSGRVAVHAMWPTKAAA